VLLIEIHLVLTSPLLFRCIEIMLAEAKQQQQQPVSDAVYEEEAIF
jgi:hypothetical protein